MTDTTCEVSQAGRDFDAIVIGAGAAGEHCAAALAAGGLEVALVERELVGGECPYWASIPSKTLLRSGQALTTAQRVPGASEAVAQTIDAAAAFRWRDSAVSRYSDADREARARAAGVHVMRGTGRLAGPHTVSIGARTFGAPNIVVATGSEPAIPAVPGLRGLAGVWTSRHVTGTTRAPRRLIIVGAGPTGVEMAQAFARLGSTVSLVEAADRLLPAEPAAVSRVVASVLNADGVHLRLGEAVASCGLEGEGYVIGLADGSFLEADRILLATGRRPRTTDIGLETVGLDASRPGIPVDDRLAVQPGLWAIGDVTGRWLLSHVGQYEGRVVADNILGRPRLARYDAVPRVTFTDPQAASVGAHEDRFEATVSIADLPRTTTYTIRDDVRAGFLTVVSDGDQVTGAHAVGPEAGEWMQQATLAIRAGVPLTVLLDVMQPFPTFSEAFSYAIRDLARLVR